MSQAALPVIAIASYNSAAQPSSSTQLAVKEKLEKKQPARQEKSEIR